MIRRLHNKPAYVTIIISSKLQYEFARSCQTFHQMARDETVANGYFFWRADSSNYISFLLMVTLLEWLAAEKEISLIWQLPGH